MISQLVDFLKAVGGAVLPWVVIDQWQRGVVLRFGKYRTTFDPGLHFVIPFVDNAITPSVVTTTTALRPQSVVTADGKVVTVESIIRWSISDARAFVLDIWDGPNVIIDSAQGSIAEILRDVDSKCIDMERKILEKCRKSLARYGIKVETVTLTTLAPVKVLRLIGVQKVEEPPQQ